MGNLIHNERVKYAATFFNAAFATGCVLPLFLKPPPPPLIFTSYLIGGAILGTGGLFAAYYMLGHLKE
jgi:hypothetical protein